jgi:DnaK suppressor protein
MPRAKQPGVVDAQHDDAPAQVHENGAKPSRAHASAEGNAAEAKRAGGKATKGAREASKDDVTTKTQHAKQHAKVEPAPKAAHEPAGKAAHDTPPKAAHESAPKAAQDGAPKAAHESAPKAAHDAATKAHEHATKGHDPAPKAHEAAARPKKAATGGDEQRDVFLEHQRALLAAERNNYTRQAEELRAEAEALALEHEPGDVQFDEEGGEGGTSNVDRELDLHLSAQAQAAIEEIDAALAKIAEGTYGFCESCGNPVPKARLEALPHARLCVSCKSGGLTARRQ